MNLKILTAALLLASSALQAQTIEVTDAWVRTTVQGQKGTGAFMRITARDGAKLVGVLSPVAGIAQVHEMKMDGDIMRMRAVPELELPAGKSVQLQPGGYHVMLMDLKQPLAKDSLVPLTLRFRDAKGTESQLELQVPVRALAPSAGAASTPGQTHGSPGHNGTGKH